MSNYSYFKILIIVQKIKINFRKQTFTTGASAFRISIFQPGNVKIPQENAEWHNRLE